MYCNASPTKLLLLLGRVALELDFTGSACLPLTGSLTGSLESSREILGLALFPHVVNLGTGDDGYSSLSARPVGMAGWIPQSPRWSSSNSRLPTRNNRLLDHPRTPSSNNRSS